MTGEHMYTEPVAGLLLSLDDDGTVVLSTSVGDHYVADVEGLIDRLGSALVLAQVRKRSTPRVRLDGVHLYRVPWSGFGCTGWPAGGGPVHPAVWVVWAPGRPWSGDCACDREDHQDHAARRAADPSVDAP